MKKALIIVIISLFISSAFSLTADAGELKLGFVDLQTILIKSNKGIEARETLSKIENAQNTLINEQINQIKKLEETLIKQESVLSPEVIKEKKAELNKKIYEYQTKGKQFKEELQKKESILINDIILNIEKILANIAQEEGYTAILNKAGVLYMPANLDLTEAVVAALNKTSSEQ